MLRIIRHEALSRPGHPCMCWTLVVHCSPAVIVPQWHNFGLFWSGPEEAFQLFLYLLSDGRELLARPLQDFHFCEFHSSLLDVCCHWGDHSFAWWLHRCWIRPGGVCSHEHLHTFLGNSLRLLLFLPPFFSLL